MLPIQTQPKLEMPSAARATTQGASDSKATQAAHTALTVTAARREPQENCDADGRWGYCCANCLYASCIAAVTGVLGFTLWFSLQDQ